ncbi:type VI secretion system protein TssA [Paraburkholderia aspalathi]|uniref:type VI secretion system protein TssA n=1 Tax=Paraburkholderia aspalathi TaxID=1324617 RepID=UPI0038B7C06D
MTSSPSSQHMDLLTPVSPEQPCGADHEYDSAFVMLQGRISQKASAQYGDFVDTPAPVNWADIERDCRALLVRTRDIRLIVMLTRSWIRQHGAHGLRDGLTLLQAMLDQYGEALHPVPTLDGERDPVVFANAIAAVADPDGMLADVRDIQLPKTSGTGVQMRDVEKAFALPRLKDALDPDSVNRMLQELRNRCDETPVALMESGQILAKIDDWCRRSLGADAPDIAALARLLLPFAHTSFGSSVVATPALSDDEPEIADQSAITSSTWMLTPPPLALPSQPGALPLRNRSHALQGIRDTRLWFEQNEPSSPVIVLLRQAERMVGKRFPELVHAIPAELLAQWDAIDA